MGHGSFGRSRLRGSGCALAMLAALAACSPQTQAEASADKGPNAAGTAAAGNHPISGLRAVPLTVTSGDERIGFKVEVADTPESQARGLMFRTELGDFEGMIFPYVGVTAQSFWMKNTPLPLDIIFVGKDRRILNIAAETTPYSTDPVSALGPTSAVFEIPGGRAAELGIEPGDEVEW